MTMHYSTMTVQTNGYMSLCIVGYITPQPRCTAQMPPKRALPKPSPPLATDEHVSDDTTAEADAPQIKKPAIASQDAAKPAKERSAMKQRKRMQPLNLNVSDIESDSEDGDFEPDVEEVREEEEEEKQDIIDADKEEVDDDDNSSAPGSKRVATGEYGERSFHEKNLDAADDKDLDDDYEEE